MSDQQRFPTLVKMADGVNAMSMGYKVSLGFLVVFFILFVVFMGLWLKDRSRLGKANKALKALDKPEHFFSESIPVKNAGQFQYLEDGLVEIPEPGADLRAMGYAEEVALGDSSRDNINSSFAHHDEAQVSNYGGFDKYGKYSKIAAWDTLAAEGGGFNAAEGGEFKAAE